MDDFGIDYASALPTELATDILVRAGCWYAPCSPHDKVTGLSACKSWGDLFCSVLVSRKKTGVLWDVHVRGI
jgi:hypothetical protein